MPQPAATFNRLISRLESLTALDAPADGLAAVIAKVQPPGPIQDASSGTWLGHPLHPVLVALPLGAWTSASVLDLLPGRRNTDSARRLIGLGLLTSLPTAFAGASDWRDTAGPERRVGLVHAVGAWTSIALYAASWKKRGHGTAGRLAGKALALAGAATLTATGYLGGHLSYGYGIGVDTNAFDSGPQDWTRVAGLSELAEGKLTQVHAAGVALLLVRRGGDVHALADRCSHRGGPLSDGELSGDCVTCPWHGSAFSLADGEVVSGPATLPQPTYEVRVDGDDVLVRRTEERALRTNPV
jgi:nitrite reductase/ring-hydroxylating ferredoxin subunit/uncharacterized membrane protein